MNMPGARVKTPVLIFLLLFCLPVAPSHAGGGIPAELLRPRAELEASYVARKGFKEGSRSVSIHSRGLAFSYAGFTLRCRMSEYNWSGEGTFASALGLAEPWKELYDLSLGMRTAYPIAGSMMLLGGISVSSGFERRISRSLGVRGDMSLMRKYGEWALAAGVAGGYNPLEVTFHPAAALRYREGDNLGLSASIGYPSVIRYRINEIWYVEMKAGLASGFYRLKDGREAEGGGYFRHRSVTPGAAASFRPSENLALTAETTYHLERKWRIYDRKGRRLGSSRLDNAPAFSVKAAWRF